jgi:hypothetical protein
LDGVEVSKEGVDLVWRQNKFGHLCWAMPGQNAFGKGLCQVADLNSPTDRAEDQHQLPRHKPPGRAKLFVKLPSWFRIDTPVGLYNPDWAFVTEREEKPYFVRSTLDSEERRTKGNQKILRTQKL